MSDLHGYIISYKQGNLHAFSWIYECSVKKIYDFLFYKTFDSSIAEDLTSDTFMKALKNMKHFSGSEEKEFLAWLYRIAYNTLVDYYRTERETSDIDEIGELIGKDAGFADWVDARSKLEEVLNYLDTISDDQKNIVLMRVWDDLSYAEISTITGKSIDNCKKIVSRVMQQIQANIAFLLCILFIL